MKSLDSNILLSAANGDCAEYALAAAMLNDALSALHEWLPADQVLFELSSGRTQVMSDAQAACVGSSLRLKPAAGLADPLLVFLADSERLRAIARKMPRRRGGTRAGKGLVRVGRLSMRPTHQWGSSCGSAIGRAIRCPFLRSSQLFRAQTPSFCDLRIFLVLRIFFGTSCGAFGILGARGSSCHDRRRSEAELARFLRRRFVGAIEAFRPLEIERTYSA